MNQKPKCKCGEWYLFIRNDISKTVKAICLTDEWRNTYEDGNLKVVYGQKN